VAHKPAAPAVKNRGEAAVTAVRWQCVAQATSATRVAFLIFLMFLTRSTGSRCRHASRPAQAVSQAETSGMQ
jgi:hypothetical protein